MDGGRTSEYGDSDLTFFMLVYRDHELAENCLGRLRASFPAAHVVVRSDGDPDPRHAALAVGYGVDYRPEERLFPVEHGGAVVERMLEIFLQRPTRYLFKIDPDTVVHRRFHYLPARGGHFGTLQGAPGYLAVQGGCMGFTADAAASIAESGLLRDPRLCNPRLHRDTGMYWEKLTRRLDRVGLTSFDWALGWAASTLGVPLFDFPEVNSTWRTPVENPCLRYAITHPLAAKAGQEQPRSSPGGSEEAGGGSSG